MRVITLVLAVVLISQAGPAGAQSTTAPSALPPVVAVPGLAEIASSLQRMELLLRGQVEMQRLDLLLKRAELGNQELLPLQNELRQTKAARDGSEEMLRVNEQQLSDFTAMLEKRAHAASEEETQGVEQQVHNLEQRIRTSKTRLQAQRARIEELENEVAKKTVERDDVKALIDRALARLDLAIP
ncbi:MAG TPA: hypothetical protein VOA80_01375 [Thermoanaerobaculia bacterium]|nr:hypothetical protein [Thermoanaerobaculia bacterium]